MYGMCMCGHFCDVHTCTSEGDNQRNSQATLFWPLNDGFYICEVKSKNRFNQNNKKKEKIKRMWGIFTDWKFKIKVNRKTHCSCCFFYYRVNWGSKFLNERREILCSFQPVLKETEIRKRTTADSWWLSRSNGSRDITCWSCKSRFFPTFNHCYE